MILENLGYRFEDVKVILADPMPASRESVRAILFNAGFRDIQLIDSVAKIRKQLEKAPLDLLICDTDLADGDVCDLVHEVRHGECGSDPFLPVVALTWEPTPDVVQKVVNSGADSLLVLPISGEKMGKGLGTLIRARKPFVVTTDYVGPDRRHGSRDSARKATLIPVPNPLKAKATGISDAHVYQESIEKINAQKVDRHATQICYMATLVINHYAGRVPDQDIGARLERLDFVVGDMIQRLVHTKHAHQAELCKTIETVVQNIAGSPDEPEAQDIELLTQLSLAIRVAFSTDDEGVEAALDIARTIGDRPAGASAA
jgi:DNA-binding NarL/FixJ family response regulator